mgnify:CR=1 FL=1
MYMKTQYEFKNRNSDFGPKETNNSNQNLNNAIETKLNTSIFLN